MSPKNPLVTSGLTVQNPFILMLAIVPALLIVLLGLAGCGGGGSEGDKQEKVVLATVGAAEITADYYESRLAKLAKNELPRNEDGTPMDMAARAGKMAFLQTLIHKETMVSTAERMGYLNDPNISQAKESLLAYEGGLEMWNQVIQEPSNTITEEELQAFYDRMGTNRECLYLITNFIEDAQKARQAALDGMDWEDVTREYHDGDTPPNGIFEISVPWGRYKPEFESGVFDIEIGEVTQPLKTSYGYWVMKVVGEKEGKKLSLEESKAQILDTTRSRKTAYRRDEYAAEVRAKYQFSIDDEALFKAWMGLPEDEAIFQPGTQTPVDKEDLLPLDIAVQDLDMPFYRFMTPDGLEVSTLGDYKAIFDRMSVFQRPKKAEMMGGMRSKIAAEIDRTIFYLQAKELGMLEEPGVQDRVNIKIEEMMVNKLYSEAVIFDERVTPEQLDEYWAANSQLYRYAETRNGRLVICLDEGQAERARAAAETGTAWKDILLQYGADRDNKAKSGKLENVGMADESPYAVALFALEAGQVSQPFALPEGKFGVVQLESVVPERQAELSEVREQAGRNILTSRKEEAFEALLQKWGTDLEIVINEENLDEVASYEELTTVEVLENLVPRN